MILAHVEVVRNIKNVAEETHKIKKCGRRKKSAAFLRFVYGTFDDIFFESIDNNGFFILRNFS